MRHFFISVGGLGRIESNFLVFDVVSCPGQKLAAMQIRILVASSDAVATTEVHEVRGVRDFRYHFLMRSLPAQRPSRLLLLRPLDMKNQFLVQAVGVVRLVFWPFHHRSLDLHFHEVLVLELVLLLSCAFLLLFDLADSFNIVRVQACKVESASFNWLNLG